LSHAWDTKAILEELAWKHYMPHIVEKLRRQGLQNAIGHKKLGFKLKVIAH